MSVLSIQGHLPGQLSMAPAYFCKEPGVAFDSLVEYPSFETKIRQAGMKIVSLLYRHLAASPFSLYPCSRNRVFSLSSKHFAFIF